MEGLDGRSRRGVGRGAGLGLTSWGCWVVGGVEDRGTGVVVVLVRCGCLCGLVYVTSSNDRYGHSSLRFRPFGDGIGLVPGRAAGAGDSVTYLLRCAGGEEYANRSTQSYSLTLA